MKSRDARAWPPYHLVDDGLVARSERKLERLERLYHLGQQHAWDGRKVLDELIARHGPPRLPPERREAALRLLSILLWGELAAWAISADLAERIDDVEAKMAAIRCYASQFHGAKAAGEIFPTGQDLYELIRVQSAHYGSLIRRPYGEPFFTYETLQIDDVVALGVQSM